MLTALAFARGCGLTTVTYDQGDITWTPDVDLTPRARLILTRQMRMAILHADSRRAGPSRRDVPWRLVCGEVAVLAPVPREASDAA